MTTTLVAEQDTRSADAAPTPRHRGVTIATVCGVLVVVVTLAVGLAPVGDNSFLTHLATGRLMADGGIVRADPYSYTAPGQSWVVQSWLASGLYGGLDRLGGDRALQLFTAAVTAVLGALLWRLSHRATSLLGRLVVVVPAVAVAGLWSERPFLLGLVALAGLLALVDSDRPVWWAAPILWCWANVHGSFPYAVVILGALALGQRADGDRIDAHERRRTLDVLRWTVIGIAAAVVNPYGVRLLTFPLGLLGRSETLAYIVEWQAPSFTSLAQRAFLAQILVLLALAVRRPSWSMVLPCALLVATSLVSSRNIVVASIVIVALASRHTDGVGSIRGDRVLGVGRLAVVALGALAGVMVLGAASSPAGAYGAYPTSALAFLDQQGRLDGQARIVAPDFVGNFLEAAYGGAVPVFVDDRVEVYPAEVMESQVDLLTAAPRWREVLADVGAEVVLWPAERPLTAVLREAGDWRIAYADPDWIVAFAR